MLHLERQECRPIWIDHKRPVRAGRGNGPDDRWLAAVGRLVWNKVPEVVFGHRFFSAVAGGEAVEGAVAFILVPELPKLRTVRTLVGQFMKPIIYPLFTINRVTFAYGRTLRTLRTLV